MKFNPFKDFRYQYVIILALGLVAIFTMINLKVNDSVQIKIAKEYIKNHDEVKNKTGGIVEVDSWNKYDFTENTVQIQFEVIGEVRNVEVKVFLVLINNEWLVDRLEFK